MKNDRVLILSANHANRHLLEKLLAKDYQILSAVGDDVLDVPFDAAILDLPALNSLKKGVLSRRARETPILLPFLLFAPRSGSQNAAGFLGTVVDELILTPIETVVLKSRLNNMLRMRRLSLELKRQYEEVQRLALTDDVSGHHNTRFLHQFLDELLAKPDAVVSLAFTDMDKFKSVVDTHGHLLGAKVLREAAQVFHEHLGAEDRIVRYGGDEYVLILPGQGKTQALAKIEKLRQGLVAAKFLIEENINLHITASIGLATFPDDSKDKKELLSAADQCLFQSKERGKNRVTVRE